jgi:hypothetical protein
MPPEKILLDQAKRNRRERECPPCPLRGLNPGSCMACHTPANLYRKQKRSFKPLRHAFGEELHSYILNRLTDNARQNLIQYMQNFN